jgi:hypothetical protein
MKTRPGFLEGVGVALVFSVIGAALFIMFNPLLSAGVLLRLLVNGLSLVYVLYLLWRTRERSGRVAVFAGWLLASVGTWAFYPPIVLFVLLHVGLIWLIRALYFYNGVVPAILDLALNAGAMLLAIGAGLHTQSLFLGVWTFFLCQALFVFIPASLPRTPRTTAAVRQEADRFENAHRVAVAALRKLSTV